MSRNIPAGLTAEVATEVSHLKTCWQIIRTDEKVHLFADHDQNISGPDGGFVQVRDISTQITNTTFATDLTGWTQESGTWIQDAGEAECSTNPSGALTQEVTLDLALTSAALIDAEAFVFRFSWGQHNPDAGATGGLEVRWKDRLGVTIRTDASTLTNEATTTTRTASWTPPALARRMELAFIHNNGAGGQRSEFDNPSVNYGKVDNYLSVPGFERTAIQSNTELSVDNVNAKGYLDNVELFFKDVRDGRLDGAFVEIFLCDFSNPSAGKIILRTGEIGQIDLGDLTYTAEIRGMLQLLQQRVGDVYAPDCKANLFDTECKVSRLPPLWAATTAKTARHDFDANIGDEVRPTDTTLQVWFKATTAGTTGGSEPSWDTTPGNPTVDNDITWEAFQARRETDKLVTGVVDSKTFIVDSLIGYPADHWNLGKIEWTSGGNSLLVMEVRDSADVVTNGGAETPTAIIENTNLTGAVTDIDDTDLSAPDANWLTATTPGNNTIVRVNFGTPTAMDTGANTQTFVAWVRLSGAATGVQAQLQLYEAAALVRSGPLTDITSTDGQFLSLIWSQSELATSSGVDVECRLNCIAANGHSVEVGVIRWYNGGQKITLFADMIETVQVGDRFNIETGCAKDVPACRDRYFNTHNMRAQPYFPGNAALAETPDARSQA